MVTKQSLGKICIVPKGEWNAQVQYKPLDLVLYGGSSYLAIMESFGTVPTNTSYWQLICAGSGGTPQLKGDGILWWPSINS